MAPTAVSTRVLSGSRYTAQDVSALLAQRRVLSEQITSATERRQAAARALRSATGAERAGLEQRVGVLDARIARLEADIDATGQQLATPEVALVASRQQPIIGWGPDTPNRVAENLAPIMIVFTIFVLCPIALSIARLFWKRGSLPRAASTDREAAQRLERMEQAMDAIAIEIERVSEGQRFVTRLMAEGKGVLGAGQPGMDPLRVPQGEKTPAR
jgi:hypothetical protein